MPNFAGLLMVLYPLLPETPYWLVLNGDLAAAETVLQRMARINGVPLPEVLPKVIATFLVELDIETPVECCKSFTCKVQFETTIGVGFVRHSLADTWVGFRVSPEPCLPCGKKTKEQ